MEQTFYYSAVLKKEESKELHSFFDDFIKNQWNGKTYFNRKSIDKILKWKKPQKIFVCSMGDLFHESVPFEWIDAVFSIMSDNDHHTYMLLTKRPQRVLDFYSWKWEEIKKNLSPDSDYMPWIPKYNIWIGVTAENQKTADERIPLLLKIPAAKRFVSCEPLLSHINLTYVQNKFDDIDSLNGIENITVDHTNRKDSRKINKLSWLITGPETGPGKRPYKKEWIESLYNQCKDANVPFFDKKDVIGLNLKQFPE